MAYDGMYGELSTRGAANEILNEAINTKDQIEAIAAEVDADRIAAEAAADRAEAAADVIAGDFQGPSGSEEVGYSYSLPDTLVRTVSGRLKDIGTVKDYGALGNGTTDDTAAFVDAEGGRATYVPEGTYLVDATQVQLNKFTGPGVILSRGTLIRLESPFLEGPVAQIIGGVPKFGWEASGPNAQIYSGAGNATQGLAWLKHNGEEKIFISQRVSGASWGTDEMVRISEWRWPSTPGADMTVVAFTEPLSMGHGSDLCALIENDEIVLFSTARNDGGAGGGPSLGGKGYSKIVWKGAATTQADVQNFKVFGDSGDGSRLFWPQRASICVTNDGKYVIIIATSNVGTGRFFFVYDRKEIETAGNVDSRGIMPVAGPVPFERAPGEFGATLQGMASDGNYLYTVWGAGAVRAARAIQVYDMSGRLRRTIPYVGPAAAYTDDELMGLTAKGIPVSFEPEGICIRDNELLTLSVDAWKSPLDVVTWQGFNWANINTTATAGIEPTTRANWVLTKLPATTTYSDATPYAAGPYLARDKKIMTIKIAGDAATDLPIADGSTDATTGTLKEYYSGTDIAYNAENGSLTIAKFYESLGTYKKFLELNFNNNLNLFSTATDQVNNRWVTMKSQWSATAHGMELRSSGGDSTEGAWIDLRAATSPTGAGEAIIGSLASNAVRLRNGSVTAATFTGTDASFFSTVAVRPVTDGTVTLGAVSRNWLSTHSTRYCVAVSTCTITSTFDSPEGVITAGPGSLHLRRSGGALLALYVKETGTGNTGWVAK